MQSTNIKGYLSFSFRSKLIKMCNQHYNPLILHMGPLVSGDFSLSVLTENQDSTNKTKTLAVTVKELVSPKLATESTI